jgi:hypothetical protein
MKVKVSDRGQAGNVEAGLALLPCGGGFPHPTSNHVKIKPAFSTFAENSSHSPLSLAAFSALQATGGQAGHATANSM